MIKAKVGQRQADKVRTFVYIDGFNFYYRVLKKYPSYKWINPITLCEQILNKDHKYIGLKYFSATVNDTSEDPSKSQRQQIYFRALRTIPNAKVVLGRFSSHKVWMNLATPMTIEKKGCPDGKAKKEEIKKVKVIRYEEKGSDVNIATEMIIDAYEDKYDAAVLISNDSDLKAPVKYVKGRLKKKVIILNPQKGSSMQLRKLATFSKDISEEHLRRSLFPTELKDAKGGFRKPPSW